MAYIGKTPTSAPLTSSDITDGIISNAKLAQDIISADTALGAEPADTDEFLVSDAGTLKRMDYSYIKASSGGLEVADQWRLTTSLAVADAYLTANLEQVDTGIQGNLGSAMTESSGVFTFPSTGFYWVKANALFKYGTNTRQCFFKIFGTADDSNYVELATQRSFITIGAAGNTHTSVVVDTLIDVTDVSTHKVKFYMAGIGGGETLEGSTDINMTYFTFLKLGAT